jgi:hypothetical protein
VVAYDEFSFIRGDSTSACDLQGRVASSKLLLNGRIPWDLSLIAWQLEHTNWTLQKLLAGGIPWYPKWLKQTRGFDPDPLLKIYPPATAVTHYWHTWGEPVYVPAVDGEGLQWNLIDWNENPPLAN